MQVDFETAEPLTGTAGAEGAGVLWYPATHSYGALEPDTADAAKSGLTQMVSCRQQLLSTDTDGLCMQLPAAGAEPALFEKTLAKKTNALEILLFCIFILPF